MSAARGPQGVSEGLWGGYIMGASPPPQPETLPACHLTLPTAPCPNVTRTMADQDQDHSDQPPEKKGTTRRHTANSQKTTKSTRSFLRRSHTKAEPKPSGGPVQDHVPCYADLHWDDVRDYLVRKFHLESWDFCESKVHWKLSWQRQSNRVR